MASIKRRIEKLEEKGGNGSTDIPNTFEVHFIGQDREVTSILILGPDGEQEWRQP